jgi:hypothetical protein
MRQAYSLPSPFMTIEILVLVKKQLHVLRLKAFPCGETTDLNHEIIFLQPLMA